jgi:hypothetical protein
MGNEHIIRCDTVQSGRSLPAIRMNILLPSSGLFLLLHSKRLSRGTASSIPALLHLLCACAAYFLNLKKDTVLPSEASVNFYQTTVLQLRRLNWTWHLNGSGTVVNWRSYLLKKWTSPAYRVSIKGAVKKLRGRPVRVAILYPHCAIILNVSNFRRCVITNWLQTMSPGPNMTSLSTKLSPPLQSTKCQHRSYCRDWMKNNVGPCHKSYVRLH